MKKLTTILFALLLSTSAIAGNSLPFFSFGLKAGVNAENQKLFVGNASDSWSTAGFNAGMVARLDFPLIPIYVQGELLYNYSKFTDVNLTGFSTNTAIATNTFSVPVLLGFGVGATSFVKLRLNAGPVFNLVSTANVKSGDFVSENSLSLFERQSVTWTAGVGVDLFRIMFDIRYNGNFKKNEVSNMGILKGAPTSWSFSLGYLF